MVRESIGTDVVLPHQILEDPTPRENPQGVVVGEVLQSVVTPLDISVPSFYFGVKRQ